MKLLSRIVVFLFLFSVLFSNAIYAADTKGGQPKLPTNNSVTEMVYANDHVSISKHGRIVVGEVFERRTRNSKHYLMDDGSYRAVITLNDQHYEDEYGNYQNIVPYLVDEANIESLNIPLSKESAADLKLVWQSNKELKKLGNHDRKDTFFRSPQVPFDVKIPKEIDKGYSIGKGKDKLTFIPINAKGVTGEVYGDNQIIYSNVWMDADVKLKLTGSGIKEYITLKTQEAPNSYSFEVKGELSNDLTSGELLVSPAWLVDATGERRDVKHVIRHEKNKTYYDLVADTSGLTFPVIIDPTVTIKTASQDTMTSATYKDDPSDGGDLIVGLSYPSNWLNTFIQFDLSSIPSTSIFSAKLFMFAFDASDRKVDNTHEIKIYRVTSPWNETTLTYATEPTVDPAYIKTMTGYNGRYSPGYAEFDISNFVALWKNGTPNYGVKLASAIESFLYIENDRFKVYTSSDTLEGENIIYREYRPYLLVDYNTAPTTPTVLSPNGGETIDSTHNITWAASTDQNSTQAELRYEVQLSINGGSTWTTLITTSPGVTSYSHNFSAVANSTSALVRVRAYDGRLYGAWDQSNATFTIKHNTTPTAPTNLIPTGTSTTPALIAGMNPVLTWTFNDADSGDFQSAYNIVIYEGTTQRYSSGWVTSGSKTMTVPSGFLSRGKTYNWKVAVKDSKGAASSYSSLQYFKTNQLPNAVMTSYTDGQQMNDNILDFAWTYSDSEAKPQTHYQVVGSKDNFTTYAYNSGEVASNAASHSTPPLADGVWRFAVRVKDGLEWSDWSYRNNLNLPNAFEPNDTSMNAFPILENNTYSSVISTSIDVDWYKFTSSGNGVGRLALTVPTGLNYNVIVYDAALNELAFGSRSGDRAEEVLFTIVSGQTYYIKIVGNGEFSTTQNYGLTVSNLINQTTTTYTYDNNGNIKSKTTTN
jgi:hypothetical protein